MAHWGVTCRGIDLGDGTPFPFRETGPNLFGWSGLRTSDTDVSGRDGWVASSPDYLGKSSRKMTLPFHAVAGSAEEVQQRYREFSDAFPPGVDLEVTIRTPEREFTVFARAREVAIPNAPNLRTDFIASVTVQLALTDPNMYGPVQGGSITLGVSTGGLSWPVVWPMRFGNVSPGALTVTNDGNRPAGIIFSIYSTGVVAPIVGVYNTGEFLSFPTLTIPSGQYLYVDTAKRIARIQPGLSNSTGSYSVKHLLDRPTSKWPLLPPGSSNVFLTGAGTGGGLVAWRSAWLV